MTRFSTVLLLALLGLSNAERRPHLRSLETMAPTELTTVDVSYDATEGEDPVTSAPTEAETELVTEEYVETSDAPSEGPIDDPEPTTIPATEVPSEMNSEMEDDTTRTIDLDISTDPPKDEDDLTCKENPETMTVDIDLQSSFSSGADKSCSEDEEAMITDIISQVLNDKFHEVVTTWNGEAHFGDFHFVAGDTVEDLDSGDSSDERRRLRRVATTTNNGERRKLEATCPPRGDLPCITGYCRWGCMEVETTHCGPEGDFFLWPLLADEIEKALNAMENRPSCLGSESELMASLHFQGGNPIQDSDTPPPSFEGTGSGKVEKDKDKEDKESEDNRDFTADDGGEDQFDVATVVQVTYFKGKGGEMNEEELDLFNKKLEELEANVLLTANQIGQGFKDYEVVGLKQHWDSDKNKLTLTFDSHVELEAGYGAGQTDHTIARVLARPDFKEHIHTLMDSGLGGIGQIVFTCVGRGARR